MLSGPIFGDGFVYDDEGHTLEHRTCRVFVLKFGQASFFGMSGLKFINSSYQQNSSTKQSLHNNESLGHIM